MYIDCDDCGGTEFRLRFEPPLRVFAECASDDCDAEVEVGGANRTEL